MQEWRPALGIDGEPIVIGGRERRRRRHDLHRHILAKQHGRRRGTVVRQRNRRAALVADRDAREVAAGRRKHLLPEIAVNGAQPRAAVEEHASAFRRPREHRRGTARKVVPRDEQCAAFFFGLRDAAQTAARQRIAQPAVHGKLDRHIPLGRAALARMAAAVVGMDAQRIDEW
jgi:hypothetical protein